MQGRHGGIARISQHVAYLGMAKTNWKSHVIELFTVVFGITLAFMLNRSYERSREKERVFEALESIVLELKHNDTLVQNGLTYHRELLQLIEEKPEEASMQIRPSSISVLAWNLSQDTELRNYLPYQTFVNLTRVYQMQQGLIDLNTEARQHISSVSIYSALIVDLNYSTGIADIRNINESPLSWKTGWTGLFEDIIGIEQQLLQLYPDLISDLEQIN